MLNSSQFQHFCDDYFVDDEITNFKLFFNIIGSSDDYQQVEEEDEKLQQKLQMQRIYLEKQGKSAEEIKKILDKQNPDQELSRIGDFDNKVIWPASK